MPAWSLGSGCRSMDVAIRHAATIPGAGETEVTGRSAMQPPILALDRQTRHKATIPAAGTASGRLVWPSTGPQNVLRSLELEIHDEVSTGSPHSRTDLPFRPRESSIFHFTLKKWGSEACRLFMSTDGGHVQTGIKYGTCSIC
jgi:hypothetical protein